MIGAVASAGQAFEKLKALLDEAENEWANPPAAIEAADSSLKHRSDRAAKPANHRVASAETLNGSVKLAAGERRILTALAQYPEGRSKVQVAVLTGYAAGGGGFNNYLAALRSQGLIQGDGDKIRIAEAGILNPLGSLWEPLPTGSALVDYWRNRLGKAERLILETLTHAYPRRWFQQRLSAAAKDARAGSRPRRTEGKRQSVRILKGPRETGHAAQRVGVDGADS